MVKQIIAQELCIDVDQLTDGTVLSEHPHMDSLVLPEILMALEDAGYTVPDEANIPRGLTVRGFVRLVEGLNAA